MHGTVLQMKIRVKNEFILLVKKIADSDQFIFLKSDEYALKYHINHLYDVFGKLSKSIFIGI